jgi:hypothetical protein
VAPIEQGVPPVAVVHVAVRSLRLLATDVANDPPHVGEFFFRIVGLLPGDLDETLLTERGSRTRLTLGEPSLVIFV